MWVVPGRTACPSWSARSMSARSDATRPSSSASMERRVHSRKSVATWSFRDRPVWSFPATGPTFAASAASTFMWTSSRAGSQSRRPASISAARASSPSTRLTTSSALRIPARPSPWTWAIDPVMSSPASAASTEIELVKAVTRASVSPLNRPPQVRIEPPSVLSVPCYPRPLARFRAGRLSGTGLGALLRIPSGRCRNLRDLLNLGCRQDDRAQPPGRILRCQVALRLGEQLVADHELPDVAAQEWRIEMGVDLPMIALRCPERRLVPAHRIRKRPLEQAVVPPDQLVEDVGEVRSRGVVEIGQARGRPLRHDEGLERPGRPERDDGQPLVGLHDRPLSGRLAIDVVEQQRPAMCCEIAALRRVLA